MALTARRPAPAPASPEAETPRIGPLHNQYGEEAAMAAQRYHDQVREIERLTALSQGWERRALSAEAEISRLSQRLDLMEKRLEDMKERLGEERDLYRHRLTTLVGEFHTAGNIILKCLEAAEGQTPKKVNMAELAKQIDDDLKKDGILQEVDLEKDLPKLPESDPNRPIPSFLLKGPQTTEKED